MRRVLAVLLVGLALAAGALVAELGAEDKAASRGPTYFQQVKPVLDARCGNCHMAGGLAPFSLRTYGQARRNRTAIAAAVRTRLMPPWHADSGYRRYLGDPSLTKAQISTITRWAAAGAPRGDASSPGKSLPPVGGGLTRADVRLQLPTYTPRRSKGRDDYQCFVVAWPDRPRYVTGFDVVPGERREVHHMIVFVAQARDAARVDAWDAGDPDAGYDCYGGPSATGSTDIAARFLAGWAPGSSGADLPEGTGQLVEAGSRLIVQIHYNLESTAPRPDRSVVELKVDDSVAKRAASAPVVNPGWLISPQSFRIPAGKRTTHTWTGDPRPFLRLLGSDVDLSQGFTIHSVLLHMHRLGQKTRLVLVRASGKRQVLLSISHWQFNWQRDYRLAKPVRFYNGDQLQIRCEHRNRTKRVVTWGENSADEMCIGFAYVSEL
jgi:Copper type II ascorbate-dependent monooxygenase, C-terminal domain/Copper type II ascorbate-dependent monooxygenase, N-terminal domain